MSDGKRLLIEARGVDKRYRGRATRLFQRTPMLEALSNVDFEVRAGESVAIVGESGSGKSTLLRVLLGLSRADGGEVKFDGRAIDPKRDRLLWLRKRTGLVFQDPYSSFNPRRTIGQTVAEPLEATRAPGDHDRLVRDMLERLDLPADTADRFPGEFSGGQRQRIAIARALVHGPELLVGDEPVSALDVLVRERILSLLAALRRELGLTMVTVTHDLGVVPQVADRVVVMQRGRVVEAGGVSQILREPREPYTRALVAALPRLPENTWSADGGGSIPSDGSERMQS